MLLQFVFGFFLFEKHAFNGLLKVIGICTKYVISIEWIKYVENSENHILLILSAYLKLILIKT